MRAGGGDRVFGLRGVRGRHNAGHGQVSSEGLLFSRGIFRDHSDLRSGGGEALPQEIEHWSLTTLREKLVKPGAKVVRHWSEAWDDELGYIEPHTLHAGDPVRLRMAQERQKHPAVRLDAAMQSIVADTIGRCRNESQWRIAAASIESTHTHLLMTYSESDVDNTVKRLKDQMTTGRGFMRIR